MTHFEIGDGLIAEENGKGKAWLDEDYEHLGRVLRRRGVEIEDLVKRAQAFQVAVPSWGLGTGGTRFARFPGPGEPRDVFEKLEDCGTVFKLVRSTPAVSLHIPWDKPESAAELRRFAKQRGLHFDAMNSNTFQDQADQKHSYKFGSLTHPDRAVREQAIAHNLECIEIGRTLGSKAHTVWIGDGGNFPGQMHFRRALDRYLESMRAIYAALPDDWRVFMEHKLYEPAFYSTVINDWGVSYHCARELGPKAFCLVDLGHHAPNVNIEILQRQQVRRRRPRRRLHQALPALPDLQRAGRRGAGRGEGVPSRLHARPVAQRDRSRGVADGERGRAAARLCAGPPRGPRGAA